MWSRGANNFGLYPSTNTTFTQYAYDANTLKLKRTGKYTIATSNLYAYSYSFIASFSIYTDQTYSEYFYKTRKMNEIQYLYGYEQLLKAKYENDELAIQIAEILFLAIEADTIWIEDREAIERYAKHLFDIEISLYV